MRRQRAAPSRIRVRSGPGGPPTVDGHPGWVAQSARQYGWLCVMLLTAQAYLTGSSRTLVFAGASAWWAVALGGFSGLLVWVPVWGLTRCYPGMGLPQALTAALGKLLGKACVLLYATLMAYDAYLALLAAADMLQAYMTGTATAMTMGIIGLLAVCVTLYSCGMEAVSRMGWLFRKGIVGVLLLSFFLFMQNARMENLYPWMGQGGKITLWQSVQAGGAFSGIYILGFMPRMTGSTKPIKCAMGAGVLLWSGMLAGLMMLAVNLCIPPMAITPHISWVQRMMMPALYMRYGYGFRIFAMMLLLWLLLFAATASMGFAMEGLREVVRTPKESMGVRGSKLVLIPATFVALALCMSVLQVKQWMIALMPWRFALSALPAWLALLIACIRRNEGKKTQREETA